MRGNLTRRGKTSWRLKYDIPGEDGRKTVYRTVQGNKREAEAELARLLNEAATGAGIDPSRITVGEHLAIWLDGAKLGAKTREVYQQTIRLQIAPHLGKIELQKLKPVHVTNWLVAISKSGGHRGRPLMPTTCNLARKVLSAALVAAMQGELVSRNVAAIARAPQAERVEVTILTGENITTALDALKGTGLYPIAALAFLSGLRRGELLALRWCDLDLAGATLRVERSIEQTRAGLSFKAPKTRAGRRLISLPPSALTILKDHRRQQLELRLRCGLGKPKDDALLFCDLEGNPITPGYVTVNWRRNLAARGLPHVRFHSLRHAHASALIAAGVDFVTVSKRLGHASPAVTMAVYAHTFDGKTDEAAAAAIERALG